MPGLQVRKVGGVSIVHLFLGRGVKGQATNHPSLTALRELTSEGRGLGATSQVRRDARCYCMYTCGPPLDISAMTSPLCVAVLALRMLPSYLFHRGARTDEVPDRGGRSPRDQGSRHGTSTLILPSAVGRVYRNTLVRPPGFRVLWRPRASPARHIPVDLVDVEAS